MTWQQFLVVLVSSLLSGYLASSLGGAVLIGATSWVFWLLAERVVGRPA